MNLSEARENVIDMGIKLLQTGLIARTWGNVSSRLDQNHFVITPSGRDYTDLTPEEIVIVNISDGRSWGDVRPSSEKGVHLIGYKNNKKVNFIVHTHQPEASVLAAIGQDVVCDAAGIAFGDKIPCAAYGFPGSDELRDAVEAAMEEDRYRIVLMAHHGAVCMGNDHEDALRLAASLEMMASYRIRRAFEEYIGRPMRMDDSLYNTVLKNFDTQIPETVRPFCRSERMGDVIVYYLPDGGTMELEMEEPALVEEQRIHQRIYKERPDIGGILHSINPSAVAYSTLHQPLGTYLDDFAQINGVEMQCSAINEDDVVAALGDNHGVLLENNGALCCGKNLYDAEALSMVLEKNARSFLVGQLFPEHPIQTVSREECEKMREFYLQSYSKRF
ncbi:MAG: class II aldolase/adducin family protein [Firmicutes bacterium]|nr:class II aldolase/adducin family protein [Bacillota bacterium]